MKTLLAKLMNTSLTLVSFIDITREQLAYCHSTWLSHTELPLNISQLDIVDSIIDTVQNFAGDVSIMPSALKTYLNLYAYVYFIVTDSR